MKIFPTKEQIARNRFKRDTRKLVFKQYDGIVTMCKAIAKSWQTERIPLKTVNETIDKAKVVFTEKDPVVMDRVNKLNSTFETFKKVLQLRSQETMNDGKISMNEIRHFVDRFKEEFTKAQDAPEPKIEENELQSNN